METSQALTTIRTLDALPVQRRRHLAAQIAHALTHDQRQHIVVRATAENALALEIEDDIQAEYADRLAASRARAQREENAVQTASAPAWRGFSDHEELPAARPVTITYTTPTKPLSEEKRREGIGLNSDQWGKRTHGITSTYNSGCRCEKCSLASREHGRQRRARLSAEKPVIVPEVKVPLPEPAPKPTPVPKPKPVRVPKPKPVKVPKPKRQPTHGRKSTYSKHGCRTDCPGDPITGRTCSQANRGARIAYESRKRARARTPEDGRNQSGPDFGR